MKQDEILLTEKELGEVCFAPTTKCDTYCDKCADRNKAQCLKLLERYKGKDGMVVIGSKEVSELEKLLKGGE